MSKYILVTSGVCSSLGKGVASASLGSLLECSGLSISMIKCDPYINLDAGNISPFPASSWRLAGPPSFPDAGKVRGSGCLP